ncbi:putative secreted protein [Cryptosporidium parvum]|nr:putative secreted protein [Cryptosporidium sp. 43IA8]
MNKLLFAIILVSYIYKFANCFISSFSGPFMLFYSVLRTIDGMAENIQHISNSMDLSLQSFLSTQFLSKISDKVDNPIVIGADYHGSVSPCELDFHPLISSNIFIERSIDKNNTNYFQVINNSSIVLPFTNNKNIQIFESTKYKTENIAGFDSLLFKRMDVNLVNKQNDINNENNYSTLLEPFHYGTKMVSTEFKNQNGNGYVNDLILATKIFNPLQNFEINNKNINNQNIPTRLGKSISSNEIFYNHQYELRETENTEFDLNSFRLYTYYTTHYLFQITSIFSMGISLHSQYRRKSRQRKLHLVK